MFHTPSALLDITLKNVLWAPISLYSGNYVLAHCMHVVNGNHRKWRQIHKQNKVMSDTEGSSRGSDDSDEEVEEEEVEEEETEEEEIEEEEDIDDDEDENADDEDDDDDEGDTEDESDESEEEYLTEDDYSDGLSISSSDSEDEFKGMKNTINTNN